jgi:hypothetical protein
MPREPRSHSKLDHAGLGAKQLPDEVRRFHGRGHDRAGASTADESNAAKSLLTRRMPPLY